MKTIENIIDLVNELQAGKIIECRHRSEDDWGELECFTYFDLEMYEYRSIDMNEEKIVKQLSEKIDEAEAKIIELKTFIERAKSVIEKKKLS